MLDGIVVNIIDMGRIVMVVIDSMLPKAALPNTAFMTLNAYLCTVFVNGDGFGKVFFNGSPTPGIIVVIWR